MISPAGAAPLATGAAGTSLHPESVNWHVTAVCNYSCRFCFLTLDGFRASSEPGVALHQPLGDASKLLRLLKEAGTLKLTFAGGEPTLCRELPGLIAESSGLGLVTMLVSNGTGVTASFLEACSTHLSAVKLSVESSSDATEARLGRGTGNHLSTVRRAAKLCREFHVPVMVNTVVTAENWDEDLHALIGELQPTRWKVFQVLRVEGENHSGWPSLAVDDLRFSAFCSTHADLRPIVEDNRLMTGSYVMVDPLGRFFQHNGTGYVYSRPILEVGVAIALGEVGWDRETFLARGGQYDLPPPTAPLPTAKTDAQGGAA